MFGIAHAQNNLFFTKIATSNENLQLAKRKEKEGEKTNLIKKHVKIEVLYGKKRLRELLSELRFQLVQRLRKSISLSAFIKL